MDGEIFIVCSTDPENRDCYLSPIERGKKAGFIFACPGPAIVFGVGVLAGLCRGGFRFLLVVLKSVSGGCRLKLLFVRWSRCPCLLL